MKAIPCVVLAGEKRLPDGTLAPSRAAQVLGGRSMANWHRTIAKKALLPRPELGVNSSP